MTSLQMQLVTGYLRDTLDNIDDNLEIDCSSYSFWIRRRRSSFWVLVTMAKDGVWVDGLGRTLLRFAQPDFYERLVEMLRERLDAVNS